MGIRDAIEPYLEAFSDDKERSYLNKELFVYSESYILENGIGILGDNYELFIGKIV